MALAQEIVGLKQEITRIDGSLRQEIARVDGKLSQEIAEVNNSLRQEIEEVKKDLANRPTRGEMWTMGGVITGILTVGLALIGIFSMIKL